ncbi:MAG: hypothetical protein ACLVJ6_14780 [Merdibacter sp.]
MERSIWNAVHGSSAFQHRDEGAVSACLHGSERPQSSKTEETLQLTRPISPFPFVPQNDAHRIQRCHEIRRIQATGLAQRLKKIHAIIWSSASAEAWIPRWR